MMTEINKGNAGWKRRAILFLTSQCITLFGSTLVQMAVVFYVTLLHRPAHGWRHAACAHTFHSFSFPLREACGQTGMTERPW